MKRGTQDPTRSMARIAGMILTLSVVSALLIGVGGPGAVPGASALDWQEMEGIVGGETCQNCDACSLINTNLLTCYHVDTYPNNTSCDTKGCIDHVILTYGCSPNQGAGADGCDTDVGTDWLMKLYIYAPPDQTCTLKAGAGGTYKLWRKIWHGCDTSAQHTCDAHNIYAACDASACPNPNLDRTQTKGTQFVCGCD